MNFEVSALSNGTRVVCVPMKERRSVATGIWVHVGGRDEEPRLNGVSHFLEHIVFKGTGRRTANQIKESVEGIGGSLNAFTSEECTCFLAKAASRHFAEVFDVLADMVVDASMTPADVEKERTVIMEEIKMTQDQPSHFVEEILSEILWPGHPLGRPLTGTLETVGGLTRDDLCGYRDAFYNPALLTVVAAGDIDAARLTAAAEKSFGRAKARTVKKPDPFRAGAAAAPAVRVFRKSTEQTHLALGMHTFPKEHPDEFALDLLSVILGGNMSSRLFNEVREERGLAYDIGSSVRKYHETGAFVVSAGVDTKKLGEAIKVIRAELLRITREPVEAGELKRAREFYLGQLDLGLENSMNAMLWAGDNMVSLGRCRTPQEVTGLVEKVTPDDVRRVAAKLFAGGAGELAVVGPVPEGAEKTLTGVLSA
ncbi:MAG TPA: pitrilysin family protein [Candidatus Eisenbacteria bacterium]|nr:pitrilysin family protein [Candidatus Eisenbacteria bacterium]